MLELKKIAITGGVASGKSSVCRCFQELGAFVVHADAVVHELLDFDADLRQKVIRLFGPEIVVNDKINRKMIAERAFRDQELLAKLEEILHPAVCRRIEQAYQESCSSGVYASFVVEIPLLFEIQWESFYDYTVSVSANETVARQRFKQAGFSTEEYDRRMKRQLSPHQKKERAQYTIQNNGTFDDLKSQVVALNNTLNLRQNSHESRSAD